MFLDAEVPLPLPAAVTVPVDAVIDSGVRQIVFVDRGNGYFEPRPVETGWRVGDRVEITRGLRPGERIVLSGTFLLDSESRMKAAAMGIAVPARDLVCGMDVDQTKAKVAGKTVTYGGDVLLLLGPLQEVRESPATVVSVAHQARRTRSRHGPPTTSCAGSRRAQAVDAPGLETRSGSGRRRGRDPNRGHQRAVVMQLGQYSALAESASAAVAWTPPAARSSCAGRGRQA
jgi:hypothetical protein